MCIFLFSRFGFRTDQDENYALGWRINLQIREIISHFFIQYIYSITVWFAALFNNIPIIFVKANALSLAFNICVQQKQNVLKFGRLLQTHGIALYLINGSSHSSWFRPTITAWLHAADVTYLLIMNCKFSADFPSTRAASALKINRYFKRIQVPHYCF